MKLYDILDKGNPFEWMALGLVLFFGGLLLILPLYLLSLLSKLKNKR